MSKTRYPCRHCGRRQVSPAVLCTRCSPNDEIRKEHGILTAADVNLRNLTIEERMMVFIYLATGKADFFDERLSLPNVEDENPFDSPPKWNSHFRKWNSHFRFEKEEDVT